jgi:hypothetical protein
MKPLCALTVWFMLLAPGWALAASAAQSLLDKVRGDWHYSGCGDSDRCASFQQRTGVRDWQMVFDANGDVRGIMRSNDRVERDTYVLEGRFLLHNRKSDAKLAGDVRLEDGKLYLRYTNKLLAGIEFVFEPAVYDPQPAASVEDGDDLRREAAPVE